MTRRNLGESLFAAFAILYFLAPGAVQAQVAHPHQTIKIIVAHPAGGLPDTITRIVGKRLQERLAQPVIVENRPGASAGIGTAALTTAPADGYTFLVTDGAILSINPLLNAKLPYNPKEVLPVAFIARAPLFLAINSSLPAADMKGLIEYAKSNPGNLGRERRCAIMCAEAVWWRC